MDSIKLPTQKTVIHVLREILLDLMSVAMNSSIPREMKRGIGTINSPIHVAANNATPLTACARRLRIHHGCRFDSHLWASILK